MSSSSSSFCDVFVENGGGVLRQHHGAAAPGARVLQGRVLRQEVPLLPQSEFNLYVLDLSSNISFFYIRTKSHLPPESFSLMLSDINSLKDG